jgi:hypothetical protein
MPSSLFRDIPCPIIPEAITTIACLLHKNMTYRMKGELFQVSRQEMNSSINDVPI